MSDDGASESGCITLITANFTSYTVNMRAMYPDSKRCASAFIFSVYSFSTGYSLPTSINIRTSHVPAVLSWNSTNCSDGGQPRAVTSIGWLSLFLLIQLMYRFC
ncbi:hypothetical protein Gotri_028223 [Gossypium trilobum]|uniref:Uncharacterized protein n=1 Tax=Gossypium trilobum TaxID=34281 RepID=A0A7J9FV62_9ROSI|nr:hypothetical protein [Gossypium trilobum]